MNLNPAVLGLLRGLGFAIVLAVLSFIGDAANLHGLLNETLAGLLAAGALALEHSLESKGQGALFGAVNRRA